MHGREKGGRRSRRQLSKPGCVTNSIMSLGINTPMRGCPYRDLLYGFAMQLRRRSKSRREKNCGYQAWLEDLRFWIWAKLKNFCINFENSWSGREGHFYGIFGCWKGAFFGFYGPCSQLWSLKSEWLWYKVLIFCLNFKLLRRNSGWSQVCNPI